MPYFSEKVTMMYYYPHMQVEIMTSLIDMGYKGIIIVGTGLGHVNRDCILLLNMPGKKM